MAYTCITGSQHAHESGASPGLTSRTYHTELYTKLVFIQNLFQVKRGYTWVQLRLFIAIVVNWKL